MERRAVYRNKVLPWLLIGPQLLLVLVFFYWPTSQALYWAFTLEQPWGGGNLWAGLDNFLYIFRDDRYWGTVLRSGFYALAATGLSMLVALTLASFVDRALKGTKLFQSVFIWPYAIAAPAAGVAFRFIFSPEAGLVGAINDIWPGVWDPATNGIHALAMVIVCHAWLGIGYNFVFFLAALQMIPRSINEAGAMDGARPFRRMLDLQLPLIAPTAFFLLIMNIISSFTDSFGLIDTMTEGGPIGQTEVMVYKIYVDGFKGLDYSGAAAQSIILMLLVIGLTFIQFKWVERRVHYN
ncbi:MULTISPECIES: ABC transporter permease subunit [unclassified Devosia]|jgi:sn-glycerol 3-phosphate transport system permease protein|uniref:ABC transporter permease subunit n=1 Tax=unclassified Devosia TaxID=196773 RepID=UPI000868B3FE|nr:MULTISPECIES: ABC transporter permease subunit [unclassified Devosia]MBN9365179.1 ABC transporter permease subunit [Devosia sp.]ODS83796.1 MAG: glycerol-3-phosphate transporter permease [Devosia sp. SCN 66-27]OJX21323.1 MAG: glycerol-3-phosphate transporter permease [Devosia sp. 66-14]